MRASTAGQKPDLQDDDLRGYAARAGLDVVQDYCDVAVSGRREGRVHARQRLSHGASITTVKPSSNLRRRFGPSVMIRNSCEQSQYRIGGTRILCNPAGYEG